MTQQEAQKIATDKAAALTLSKGVKVYPIIFKESDTSEEFIFGYMTEPPRFVKLRVLDKSNIGGYTAANELLDAVLIKEESDPRISSERSEDDPINIGATIAAYDLIQISINAFKKK